MKKLLIAAALVGVLAAGAGAAVLSTSSTVPVTITVPYTIGDQTGQVEVTKDVIVPVETVTVTVTQPTTTTTPPPPPAGTITQNIPAGVTISGTGTWSATYSGDPIASLKFYVDNTLVSTDTSSPYSISLNTSPYPDGQHTLRVDAVTSGGTVAATNSVNVTVQNGTGGTTTTPPPPPTTTTPPPPPPPGGTTMTQAQLQSACGANGAVIDSVTVSGSGVVQCTGSNVTIKNSTLKGFNLEPYGSGFKFVGSSLNGGELSCYGTDNGLIENSTLDGGGKGEASSSNAFEDYPAGNGCQHWVIRGNLIKNYHGADCNTHAEGLRIGGYANDFLIENNTFENNGCTSHIFFTYWGADGANGYRSAQLPHDICVRGNTFGPLFRETYVDINFRQEINQAGPAATGIKIDPDQGASTTNAAFNLDC